MSNNFETYRKNKCLKEKKLIIKKINNYKNKNNNKYNLKCINNYKNKYNYNYNISEEIENNYIIHYKFNLKCINNYKTLIINKFRKCYEKIYNNYLNKKEKYKILNDYIKNLLYINNDKIKLYVAYSKIYGIYMKVKIINENKEISCIKYLEEITKLKNVNIEDQKKILELQRYIKSLESSVHYFTITTQENIGFGRRDFMRV